MDRSDSMQRFVCEPLMAINEHLRMSQAVSSRGQTVAFVMTFADDHRFDLNPNRSCPCPNLPITCRTGTPSSTARSSKRSRPCSSLKAEGESHGAVVCIILAVFTEGEDNVSQADRTELVRISGEALEAGVELILVGLGRPAKQIARYMGFPADGAIQVAATPEAMRQTMTGVTHRTHLTMTGYGAPVTPTPPSSHSIQPGPSSRPSGLHLSKTDYCC